MLAGAVLSLLRAIGGLDVEPSVPTQLRAAIHELAAALGTLAENPETGASAAVGRAARAARLAGESEHGSDTHASLIAPIIAACVRDLYRVVGAEPD